MAVKAEAFEEIGGQVALNEEIMNVGESKVSIKIETNSRGHNTTVHVYQGVSEPEIDETVARAIYAHQKVQTALQGGDKSEND